MIKNKTKLSILFIAITILILGGFSNCRNSKITPVEKNSSVEKKSSEDSSFVQIKIETDTDTYLPVMSSTVGIGLTPIYSSKKE